jgi:N-acetylmuramoyl-L-alanine amidase/LysM repeat protein
MPAPRLAAAFLALALLLAAPAAVALAGTDGAPAGTPSGAPFRVLIDAGHGGSDPGTIGTAVPLMEKDVSLKMALLTGAALQRRGVSVAYTRTDDRYVALAERAAMAERSGASLLLSLHLNSAADPAVSGVEAWYGSGARGADLAGAVLAGLSPALRDYGLALRGTRSGAALAVLKTPVSAALIELGYVTNPREASLLTQPAFLERLAEGLAAGVVRFRDGVTGAGTTTARGAAGAAGATDVYFIRPGDTLQTVASRFRTAAADLARLNPVIDPQRLLPGFPLQVPAVSAAAAVPVGGAVVASWSTPGETPTRAVRAGAQTHVVQAGETLSGIALRYGLATADLARWNGIAQAGRILVGQSLRLSPPPGGGAGTGTPGPASGAGGAGETPGATKASTASSAGASPASGRRYRVQPGDTLSGIALRFGVSTEALLEANRLRDPNLVVAGSTLAIPIRADAGA